MTLSCKRPNDFSLSIEKLKKYPLLLSLTGISDPQVIGDKPKWFSNNLEAVFYQVHDKDSRLCQEPWIDVNYEPSLIFDEEEETPNNDDDDDSSSCYSSVSDVVMQMISGEINGATPTGPQVLPFDPVRASSPLPDVQASFATPGSISLPYDQLLRIPFDKQEKGRRRPGSGHSTRLVVGISCNPIGHYDVSKG